MKEGRRAAGKPRFYKSVAVASRGGGFRVLLDGRSVRTPASKELLLPTRALAEAIATEWEAQRERIDPASLPLNRLINTAIDGIVGREAAVRADIVKYACSDLVCYRAQVPPELVGRQTQSWDPILAWSETALSAPLQTVQGIAPATQPAAAGAAIGRALEPLGPFELAAIHTMTTLMGSAVLALAHALGQLTVEEAWAAAHVDEDWQISQWGEDAEAKARRDRRWAEMQAASRLLALLVP
jgi:chaperone required for assembly of F1-ATPase